MLRYLPLLLLVPALSLAQDVRLLPGCAPAFQSLCGEADPPETLGTPGGTMDVPPPLFTPETVARDTPQAMLTLLNDPTVEHADAFLDYQAAALRQIQAAQALLTQRAQQRLRQPR